MKPPLENRDVLIQKIIPKKEYRNQIIFLFENTDCSPASISNLL